jgi:hypothetical protein
VSCGGFVTHAGGESLDFSTVWVEAHPEKINIKKIQTNTILSTILGMKRNLKLSRLIICHAEAPIFNIGTNSQL